MHLGCKQGENACATTNIQHHFALDQVCDALNGILIAPSSDGVLQHLLVNTCVARLLLRGYLKSFCKHCCGGHVENLLDANAVMGGSKQEHLQDTSLHDCGTVSITVLMGTL